jgi:hypothetical protein
LGWVTVKPLPPPPQKKKKKKKKKPKTQLMYAVRIL